MNHLRRIFYISTQHTDQFDWLKKQDAYDHSRFSRIDMIVLTLILSIGIFLRLYGINFGLPFRYDPDEPTFVATAGAILSTKDLNPHWFGHPGTTTIYSLSILYGIIYVFGRFAGFFRSPEDFRILYHQDPTLTYLSGRLLMVAFSIISVIIVILIAKRLFGKRGALFTGFILSITPLYVHFSKLIRTDIQAALFILIAFYFCLNILEKGETKEYILAGIFSGLAIATKYPSVIITLSIALAHLLRVKHPFHDIKKLASAVVFTIMGTFIASPFLFLDFRSAWVDILKEARPSHLGATGTGFFSNLVWYLNHPLRDTFSAFGLLISIVGLIFSVFSRQKKYVLLALFPVSFTIFIASLNLRWDRWVIPAIPFLCMTLVLCVLQVEALLRRKNISLPAALAFPVTVLIIGMILMTRSYTSGQILSAKETRTLASEWILANIPSGSRVLEEVYTPQLPKYQYQFYYVDQSSNITAFDTEVETEPLFSPMGHIGDLKDTSQLFITGIDFFVLGSMYERYIAEKAIYPEIVSQYETIIQHGQLLHEVKAIPGENQGPSIRIYKVIKQ